MALLVLATVRDPGMACAYLLVSGAGTLLGMVLVTAGFALPVIASARRWAGAGRLVRLSTGATLAALVVKPLLCRDTSCASDRRG